MSAFVAPLIVDGENICITCEYAEAYIPEAIIINPDGAISPSAIAYESGSSFNTLGIFYIRFFNNEEDSRDSIPLHTMIYPNIIESYPSDATTSIYMTIGDAEPEKYRVLKYYQGDALMESTSRKSHTNCEMFMRLLSSARLPRSLTYDQVFTAWMDNYNINGMTPQVPAVVLQMIVSEMYRNPNNPSEQFSKVVGKNLKADPKGYVPMTMNQVSAYSSVMSALSFERITEKVTSALIMSKNGVPQKKSPVERIITM